MPKAKTTEVHYEVTGYHKHYYIDTPVVRVVVSGTYEGQNLKGVCLVNDEKSHWRGPVELTGDGRYSFLIGGRSLHQSDAAATVIMRAAQSAASDWQTNNPTALHEFNVAQAIIRLERANGRELQAKNDLQRATKEREEATLALAALQAIV